MILRPIHADLSTRERTSAERGQRCAVKEEPRSLAAFGMTSHQDCVPAWEAVARVQRQAADSWWLISQPDHAALSGAIASAFVAPGFPQVDPDMAKAIGLHDSGWALFESEADVNAAPMVHCDGRPVAFFELAPRDFLRAWAASIERAEQVCAAFGYIVS